MSEGDFHPSVGVRFQAHYPAPLGLCRFHRAITQACARVARSDLGWLMSGLWPCGDHRREIGSHSGKISNHSHEIGRRSGEISNHSHEISSHSGEISRYSREIRGV
jgi:hypothetical protein